MKDEETIGGKPRGESQDPEETISGESTGKLQDP